MSTCPICGGNPCDNPSFCESCRRADAWSDSEAEKTIDELAQLTDFAYQRHRAQAAKDTGFSVRTLDKLVAKRRAAIEAEAEPQPLYSHWAVEPWAESVSGNEVIA